MLNFGRPQLRFYKRYNHEVCLYDQITGFSAMVDRMVWALSLSRDRKLPRVTKFTHSRAVSRIGSLSQQL